MMPDDARDPEFRKLRKRFLVGYSRNIPYERQANHCIGCRKCVEKCPQKINIPRQMERIDRYIEKLKQEKI